MRLYTREAFDLFHGQEGRMRDREKSIEAYLRRRVEEAGGVAFKFTAPGNDGVPDRLIILPGGRVTFVELKAPGGRLTGIQRWQQERIRRRGCDVRTIWTKAQADEFMQEKGGASRGV